MRSLSEDIQSIVTESFSSTPRYLDDLLHIGINFLTSWSIYPSELQLNKASVSDTEASL